MMKYPDTKIILSKFTKLRPAYCVVVGCSGSHNVCVCKIHQNMKFKIHGLNRSLGKNEKNDFITELTEKMLCPRPNQSCNLLVCNQCPDFSMISISLRNQLNKKKLLKLVSNNGLVLTG